ncbi:Aldehyde dehydrogenase X-like protein [Emericellopsis cladophorae]|uniref:aldehyde dehydrogenase (NAD(+)) n=1 Tax=Emericellopsis cladophorae TaxID=2686198 RepID=A0A9P9Y0K6_9HYPO|nr:Aldehyde dehydrogenase X-like protein [Emericellopsis cladophorae]KAI6781271.1 Aldehyde dehydrogenase X-like protein [Emericellopsis cladophorae]
MSFPWSTKNLPKQLFINNEYVDSKNSKKLECFNPKDNSVIASDVSLGGEADVDAAVAHGQKAFQSWRKTTAKERRDCLNKLADLIDANAETLAQLTRLSLGAPWASFGSFEIALAAEAFRYFAGWTDKFAGETYPQEDGFLKIIRNEPLGVCAGIIPWNGPLGNVGMKAGPALATGNTFILKPSEKTPFSALALGTLIKEAGFPPGVFQIVTGEGSTGALLASHMKVQKVSFTGSTATGRRIQEMAAKSNLKRVTLELGGKSPAVVFDDADLENAIAWCANAITTNTGQVCFAASRVYVQEGIYDKFVQGYKAAMEEKGKAAGDPDAKETLLGPLVDKSQYDRVLGFIERGKKQGKLLTGGGRIGEDGFYVQPTVFEGTADDAEITREEIFGPVSVLNKFKTEEEIIAKSNDTHYGLMAGVFTQDINRALRFASDVDAGMVGINAISMAFLTAPFGGTKTSGVGRENAIDALRMYTDKKTIFINMAKL